MHPPFFCTIYQSNINRCFFLLYFPGHFPMNDRLRALLFKNYFLKFHYWNLFYHFLHYNQVIKNHYFADGSFRAAVSGVFMRKITTSDQKNIIGSRIRQLRMARKLTQDELAARLQVNGYNFSKLTILRIELGKRLVTDIELKGLCEFFETDPNSLLDYRPDSQKETIKDPFIHRF